MELDPTTRTAGDGPPDPRVELGRQLYDDTHDPDRQQVPTTGAVAAGRDSYRTNRRRPASHHA